MADIVSLDDYREHLALTDINGDVRIIPRSFFEDVVDGKRKLTDLEEHETVTPLIVEYALRYIYNYMED